MVRPEPPTATSRSGELGASSNGAVSLFFYLSHSLPSLNEAFYNYRLWYKSLFSGDELLKLRSACFLRVVCNDFSDNIECYPNQTKKLFSNT